MNFPALRPAARIFAEAAFIADVVACSKATYFLEAAGSFSDEQRANAFCVRMVSTSYSWAEHML